MCRYAPVAAVANYLFDTWRAAADAEERRAQRVAALQNTKENPQRGSDDATPRHTVAVLSDTVVMPSDPTRATAVVMIGEALKAAAISGDEPSDGGGGSADMASSIESAAFDQHGGSSPVASTSVQSCPAILLCRNGRCVPRCMPLCPSTHAGTRASYWLV